MLMMIAAIKLPLRRGLLLFHPPKEQRIVVAILLNVKYNTCKGKQMLHSVLRLVISFQDYLFEGMRQVERQRRVYSVKRDRNQIFSGVLLALAAVVVLCGLTLRREWDGFTLHAAPSPTAIPLDESFDETMTTAELELPGAAWYALQVGVFENPDTAQESSQAFVRRGAAGYIWQDGRYRVLAAAYPSKEDAQLVREQLADQHAIDSYLYAIEMPSVTLRLSGMQGQIDILNAAFAHVHDVARQLHDCSVALDRQENSAEEICRQLAGLSEQMGIVVQRIRQRFASPMHPTVKALVETLESFRSFCEGLNSGDHLALWGMKLKYQTIEILWQIRNIYTALQLT